MISSRPLLADSPGGNRLTRVARSPAAGVSPLSGPAGENPGAATLESATSGEKRARVCLLIDAVREEDAAARS